MLVGLNPPVRAIPAVWIALSILPLVAAVLIFLRYGIFQLEPSLRRRLIAIHLLLIVLGFVNFFLFMHAVVKGS